MKILTILTTCAAGMLLAATAGAQTAPVGTLYKTKCAACHGADGRASTPAGKAMGARDFHSPAVQNQTDAELIAAVTNGKGKMLAYGKLLSPAEIKSLVAYVRELGKK